MEKEKLIKGLIYIAVIITLCTVASKVFFKSGETLQEYAQNNPELAYAVNEDAEIDSADDAEDNTNTTVNDDNKESISPDRVTYAENFYYEPIIIYDDLCYVHVIHYDFDGEITDGELVCNQAIAQDLVEIFYELYKAEYQIGKIRLIDEYGGDANLSMEDNNTFCFNNGNTNDADNLSKHTYGLAIDINPLYNPCIHYNEDGSLHIEPVGSEPYADRSASFPYKIDENDLCLKLFKEHGFTWGGDWNSMKDYQHFQKVIE